VRLRLLGAKQRVSATGRNHYDLFLLLLLDRLANMITRCTLLRKTSDKGLVVLEGNFHHA